MMMKKVVLWKHFFPINSLQARKMSKLFLTSCLKSANANADKEQYQVGHERLGTAQFFY